jgi:hypothetical protein
MTKFLYFAVAGDNATAYPLEALNGIDTAAGKLHLYFKPQRLTHVVTGDANDSVVLSVGADEKAALKDIVEAITATGSMKEPMIVIADSENGVMLSSNITACDSINYAA